MNKYFTLLILFISLKTFAGGELQAVGARQAGMGNASVGLSDVFATNYNQAGLGFLSTISLGASTELRYTQLGIYNSQFSVASPMVKLSVKSLPSVYDSIICASGLFH